MNKDPNYIAKLEKAIAEKYGKEAIDNPKKFWTKEKEKKHLDQLKEFYRLKESRDPVKVDNKGFLIARDLLDKKSERQCPVCEVYSFHQVDDLYMNKFECCQACFIKWVEGREERWLAGWRPPQEN